MAPLTPSKGDLSTSASTSASASTAMPPAAFPGQDPTIDKIWKSAELSAFDGSDGEGGERPGDNDEGFHNRRDCNNDGSECSRCFSTCEGGCSDCGMGSEADFPYPGYFKNYPENPSKDWKPFLNSFAKFPNLPIELRQTIWRFTLRRRTVEVLFSTARGFYSLVKTPVALRVSKDSRIALFNFFLDTLYFDFPVQHRVSQFLVGMTDNEAKQLQSMAVHAWIDEYVDQELINDDDIMVLLKKATKKMPAIKEFFILSPMGEDFNECGLPQGDVPLELFEELTFDIEKFIYYSGLHRSGSDFERPPNYSHELEGFEVPRKISAWGWRPTKLECPSYPIMFDF